MKMKSFIVDSFTDEVFKGNTAGVCLLPDDLPEERMLLIAKEFGFSETAFVKKLEANTEYAIRFFSPKMEIPLCGHATLASAKILLDINSSMDQVHLINIDGIDLQVTKEGDSLAMEFPIYKTIKDIVSDDMLAALGINQVRNVRYNHEFKILLIEIESSIELRELNPDFKALIRSRSDINGVLITAKSIVPNYDFESRYFWPWSGTNEDPVTGGTHTFLGKYWSDELAKKKLRSFQCSERTGFMEVEILSEEVIKIRSSAVTVFSGELKI